MRTLLVFGFLPFLFAEPITEAENEKLQKECGFFSAPPSPSPSRSMRTENATREEAPWAVQIRYSASGDIEGAGGYCSGTVISRRHIVTAAHCVKESYESSYCCPGGECKPSSLKSMLIVAPTVCTVKRRDVPFTCDTSEFIRVTKVYSNRKFDKSRCLPQPDIFGDVAVIELEKDLDFNERLRPACLNTINPSAGTDLTIHGYGNQEDFIFGGGIGGGILRKHNSTVITDKECNMYKSKWFKGAAHKSIDDICSKHPKGMACMGDSGSGQIFYKDNRAYLTATTSYGAACQEDISVEQIMDFSCSTIFSNRWIASVTGVNPGFTVSEAEKKSLEQEYFVYEQN